MFFVVLTLVLSSSAFAITETFLKIPVLVHDNITRKTVPVSQLKFLNLPSAVIVSRKTNAANILEQLSKKITNERYELEQYTYISEYLDDSTMDEKSQLCYVGNPEEAVALLGNLADSFLSDQTQLYFYRIAGEPNFRDTNKNDKFVLPGSEEYGYTQQFLKTNLKPGQILTYTAYTDDGDDQNLDIISQCK